MKTTSCVVVVGYNGNRVHDIQKLRDLCKTLYNARLILVVERIAPDDDQVADHVCSASMAPEDVTDSLELVVGCLAVDRWKLIGVLPFSDRGVLLGAALASHYGLPGITPNEARAGLDKQIFRKLEATSSTAPEDYRPVFSTRVESLAELRQRVVELGGRAFIKPACEGASRGCRVIHHPSECDEAWQALKPYRNGGIVLEELVRDAREYSWDYVAGSTWTTEKPRPKAPSGPRSSRWCLRRCRVMPRLAWQRRGGTCRGWCPWTTVPTTTKSSCALTNSLRRWKPTCALAACTSGTWRALPLSTSTHGSAG